MRPSIQFIKNNNLGKDLIGVEIGVYQGGNAEDILQNLPIKKIYLIDPYIHYEEYKCNLNFNFEGNFETAKRVLSKFENKIVWVKRKSSESNDIPNNLDFVYINGNHSYKYVKQDLENYCLKSKRVEL